MATLTNESTRGLGLPGWAGASGGRFLALVLLAGASVEVPDEYLEYLKAEVPGVSAFFALERGLRVTRSTPRTVKAEDILPAATVARVRALMERYPEQALRFGELFAPHPAPAEMPTEEDIAELISDLTRQLDELENAEAAADDMRAASPEIDAAPAAVESAGACAEVADVVAEASAAVESAVEPPTAPTPRRGRSR